MKIKLQCSDLYFEVDDEDFERISQFKWRLCGTNKNCIYRHLHRIFVTSVAQEIMKDRDNRFDHIDRDFLNNHKRNLRPCNHSQNIANQGKKSGTYTSRYKGVAFRNDNHKWRAYIDLNGRRTNLGTFTEEILAAIAYDDAAMVKFGEFACLNFPLYGA